VNRGRLAALASWVAVTAAVAATPEVPSSLESAVDRAGVVGAEIMLHDSAASRATDVLADRGLLARDKRLRGWLTDVAPDADAVDVTFVGEVEGDFVAVYRLRLPNSGKWAAIAPVEAVAPLDASQAARWKARVAAMEALNETQGLCARQYNTVVLPPASAAGAPIRVYLFAATDLAGVVVAGGHRLYEFSADGATLVRQRGFTKSCLTVEPPDDAQARLEAMVLTHLLDPTPTEIHVFLSLLHRRTIFVATTENDLMWKVAGSTIVPVDMSDRKSAP
jgi:hypothetical protein